MAGPSNKRRPTQGRSQQRPAKRQKKQTEYHSGSESDQGRRDFDAVNLLDSDDDVHDAAVDAAADTDEDDASGSDHAAPRNKRDGKLKKKPKPRRTGADATDDDDDEGGEVEGDEDDEAEDGSDTDESDLENPSAQSKARSKRNDPSAFATSLSKILSAKLSSSKRSDPVLARSAAAHEASKAAVDSALEARARRHLKEQKRRALERGRVRDVLLATRGGGGGEPAASAAETLGAERKLRDVAKRGVIKMFNAVRAAQIKASEAERDAKRSGVIGVDRRAEKINELSKKGFLDLIASGGGGLKKAALEEA